MSIAIIFPSGSTWESAFGRSLTSLVGQLAAQKIPHTTIVANYVTRMPCHFVCHNMAGERMDSRGKTGLEQAKRVALGVALINMDYIRNLPKPWFNFVYNNDTQDFSGEDYYFSDLCTKNNIDMWVDHDVSNQVAHVKTIHLMADMVL